MRRITGTIGATLAVAAIAVSATPASAGPPINDRGQGDLVHPNIGMETYSVFADGSVRFLRDSPSVQICRPLSTRSGGKAPSSD